MTSTEYERFRLVNRHFYLAPFDLLNPEEIQSLASVDADRLCADMTATCLVPGWNPGKHWHAYYPHPEDHPAWPTVPVSANSGRCASWAFVPNTCRL